MSPLRRGAVFSPEYWHVRQSESSPRLAKLTTSRKEASISGIHEVVFMLDDADMIFNVGL